MNETLRSPLSFLSGRWPMLLLRLALGGLFIASSLCRLEYPGQFSESVLSYQMLPEALARPFAAALPSVELFIGCSLVLGIFVVFACALIIPLILSLAMAVVGAQKSPPAEAIDTALGESRIALVFRCGGDAGAISDDLVVLSDVRSRFAETVYVDYCRTGHDPWIDRKFPMDEQIPALFITTGQDSNRFVVQHRLESPLDAGTAEAVILQVLDEASGTWLTASALTAAIQAEARA